MLFIFNPFSGKAQIKSKLFEIIDVFVKGGYEVIVHPTQAVGDGFEKTKELAPGEKQKMTLHIPVKNLASYDDSGVAGHKSCYVSEAGAYVFHVGDQVEVKVNDKSSYVVEIRKIEKTGEEDSDRIRSY